MSLTIRLGSQVARVQVRKHGHTLFEPIPGGERFAGLFPDLVGQPLVITTRGCELAGNPRLIEAVGWLTANGYMQRG
jgi:hypothetical protein